MSQGPFHLKDSPLTISYKSDAKSFPIFYLNLNIWNFKLIEYNDKKEFFPVVV